jgi:hypothetical protein
MSRTDILITPCGGVGTVLTFLPVGATAIVMNYWHTTLQTSVQMERNYYWNLEYLDIQFFPVLAEDYELTTDRPKCEKGPDDPFLEGQVRPGPLPAVIDSLYFYAVVRVLSSSIMISHNFCTTFT